MGSCGAGGMTSSTGGSGDALRHAERFKICASSVETLKSGLTALLALEIEIGFEKRPWTPRGLRVRWEGRARPLHELSPGVPPMLMTD